MELGLIAMDNSIPDKTGNCFFCCKEIPTISLSANNLQVENHQDGNESRTKDEMFSRFFTLASRYLSFTYPSGWFNPEKALYEKCRESKLKESGNKVCKDCFQSLDSFCDMYELHEHLQLELNRSLEKMADVIRAVPTVTNLELANNIGEVDFELQEFKEAFVKQGKKNYNTIFRL